MPSGTTPWRTWTGLRPVSNRTFMDKAVTTGFRNSEEALNNAIDDWHQDPDDRKLFEYLGMTSDEFGEWMTNPEALSRIIARRKANAS